MDASSNDMFKVFLQKSWFFHVFPNHFLTLANKSAELERLQRQLTRLGRRLGVG